MPATSTSPVKILLDLGIDLDNLSSEEDYLSALMEASAILQASGQTDQRFKILTDEVRAVRKSRKAAAPSKGMQITKKKISAASFKKGGLAKQFSQGVDKVFSAGSSQGGQGGDLLVIKEKVVSIEALLGEQYKLQEENAKDAKEEAEKKRRSLKERLLEGGKNVWGGIKKVAGTILKPFKSIWTKILDFIKTVFLGKILVNILKWGQDPKNQDKIKSIFKFLKDWWPVLLTAYLAFGNGLSKFVLGLVGKLAIWSVKLLSIVIPALWKAVVAMGPKGWIALGLGAGAIGLSAYMSKKDDPDLVGEEKDEFDVKETEETQKLNKGGQVAGSGNTDTVPAMLTPGEFVMSKGAVQKFGANTLASMNAMGGGTNRPTLMGGYNEGGFANITNTLTTSSSDSDGNFGFGVRHVLPEEAKERISAMGMPSMELFDGTVVPNFGQMGAESLTKGLQLTRDMMVENGASPERIAKIDELMANPNAQPGNVANMINRIVPGSTEQVMGDMGDSITASARMNGGGLVQGFQGGGGVMAGIGNIMQGRTWGGESRKQIGRGISKSRNIRSLPKKKPKVVVVDESPSVDSSQSQLPQSRSREIPNFSAIAKRSSRKMEVLGISV